MTTLRVQTALSDAHAAQKSLDRLKTFMKLRGLQPSTLHTLALGYDSRVVTGVL